MWRRLTFTYSCYNPANNSSLSRLQRVCLVQHLHPVSTSSDDPKDPQATIKDPNNQATFATDHIDHHEANNNDHNNNQLQEAQENHNKDELNVAEWIPPNRPLSGDLREYYYEQGLDPQFTSPTDQTTLETTTSTIDWLSTRRNRQALSMDLPDKNRRMAGAELEIHEGHLLSLSEMFSCLTGMGAQNVLSFPDTKRRLGSGGAEGIVLATASSSQHLQLLSDTLVRQLKVRKLAQRGVVGAQLGAEGSTTSLDWHLVDCHNYIVHIMLEETRKQLNLEALWGDYENELYQLRLNDEDSMDDYVARNPAPLEFGALTVDWEDMGKHVSQLQKYNMPHKPVVAKPKRKSRNRRDPRLL